MPANATIALASRTWTRVSAAAVTALRIQNHGPYAVLVQATPDTTAPTDEGGAVMLTVGGIITADRAIADLWPGIAGTAHVWVWSAGPEAKVSVSHV